MRVSTVGVTDGETATLAGKREAPEGEGPQTNREGSRQRASRSGAPSFEATPRWFAVDPEKRSITLLNGTTEHQWDVNPTTSPLWSNARVIAQQVNLTSSLKTVNAQIWEATPWSQFEATTETTRLATALRDEEFEHENYPLLMEEYKDAVFADLVQMSDYHHHGGDDDEITRDQFFEVYRRLDDDDLVERLDWVTNVARQYQPNDGPAYPDQRFLSLNAGWVLDSTWAKKRQRPSSSASLSTLTEFYEKFNTMYCWKKEFLASDGTLGPLWDKLPTYEEPAPPDEHKLASLTAQVATYNQTNDQLHDVYMNYIGMAPASTTYKLVIAKIMVDGHNFRAVGLLLSPDDNESKHAAATRLLEALPWYVGP